MTDNTLAGLPLVTDSTRAQSENVETVVTRLRNKRLIIPPYQRDAEQWDIRKESLFIESILNNLTVPAFFFASGDGTKIEVVDGQQRLSTILKFANNEFPLCDDDSIVYLTPQSVHYRGKLLNQLPDSLQSVFNDYPLTIIYLPSSIDLGTKLEIFRRINEGGTPLSAQDIRLAYYSESATITKIRLAGLHSKQPASVRMLDAARDRGVTNPWDRHPDAYTHWQSWWEGKVKARGQTPSEMFLWYLITLFRDPLNSLLSDASQMKHLPLAFRGSTEEALDVFCAQLRWTEEHGGVEIFPGQGKIDNLFDDFVKWIGQFLSMSLSGVSVDKYKQVALTVAALVELGVETSAVSHDAWDALADFIRTPRKVGKQYLPEGYPEQKGRWGGANGQYAQCKTGVELIQKVLAANP